MIIQEIGLKQASINKVKQQMRKLNMIRVNLVGTLIAGTNSYGNVDALFELVLLSHI